MSKLRIIVPHGIALRREIYEDEAPVIAAMLERQLPIFADEAGRAAAVIEQDGVAYIFATINIRRNTHEILDED